MDSLAGLQRRQNKSNEICIDQMRSRSRAHGSLCEIVQVNARSCGRAQSDVGQQKVMQKSARSCRSAQGHGSMWMVKEVCGWSRKCVDGQGRMWMVKEGCGWSRKYVDGQGSVWIVKQVKVSLCRLVQGPTSRQTAMHNRQWKVI